MSAHTDEPTDGLEAGRDHRETFSQIPDWVSLADIPPQALALYVRLYMHVNGKRADGVVWPGMDALAQMMGYSRRQSLRPHLTALVEIGALGVRRVNSNTGRRNVYVVHKVPRDDYTGPRTLREFYDQRRQAEEARMGATPHQRTDAIPHQRKGGTPPNNHTKVNETKETRRFTPPGEDDCASSTPKQVSGRQLMLKQPKGYATMDRPAAAHSLTSVFIAAVTHVGLKPSHGAENSIGKWVNTVAARGITHDELWRQFVNVTEKAVSGERCAWLIDDGAPF